MTRNEGHFERLLAVPVVMGLQNEIIEREFMKNGLESPNISTGGSICRHRQIELIARIENYQAHKSINLYTCKDCNQTLVMKNRTTPVVVNGEFRSKKVLHELAMAV